MAQKTIKIPTYDDSNRLVINSINSKAGLKVGYSTLDIEKRGSALITDLSHNDNIKFSNETTINANSIDSTLIIPDVEGSVNDKKLNLNVATKDFTNGSYVVEPYNVIGINITKNAIAIGKSSTASNDYAHSFGYLANAEGYASTAIGLATKAIGKYSLAMGENSTATGQNTIVGGYHANATGPYSIIFGKESTTDSTAEGAVVLGVSNEVTAKFSTVVGFECKNSGLYSTTIGDQAETSGNFATSIGNRANAKGESSVAINGATGIGAKNSIAIGGSTSDSAENSIAIGGTANNNYDIGIGYGSSVKNTSVAIGSFTIGAIANTINFDSSTVNRTIVLNDPSKIFFRNEANDSSKTSLTDYTSGKTLTQYIPVIKQESAIPQKGGNNTLSYVYYNNLNNKLSVYSVEVYLYRGKLHYNGDTLFHKSSTYETNFYYKNYIPSRGLTKENVLDSIYTNSYGKSRYSTIRITINYALKAMILNPEYYNKCVFEGNPNLYEDEGHLYLDESTLELEGTMRVKHGQATSSPGWSSYRAILRLKFERVGTGYDNYAMYVENIYFNEYSAIRSTDGVITSTSTLYNPFHSDNDNWIMVECFGTKENT